MALYGLIDIPSYIYNKIIKNLTKNDKKLNFNQEEGKIYFLAIHLPFVVMNARINYGGAASATGSAPYPWILVRRGSCHGTRLVLWSP